MNVGPVDFRLLQREARRVRFGVNFSKFLARQGRFAFAVIGQGVKNAIVQLRRLFFGALDRHQILRAGLFLIAHQRVGGSDADLRRIEMRIDD